jgi:plastocyanin
LTLLKLPHVLSTMLIATVTALAPLAPVAAQTPTPTPTATATPTPVSPVVLVGAGEPGYSVNLYGSSSVTVAQGTTVSFRPNWLEPHTVSFVPAGAPMPSPEDPRAPAPTNPGQVVGYTGSTFLNSGFIVRGMPAFQVSFPQTGAFPFLCIIHPGMAGTVNVVAPGAAGISTQAALDATASTTFANAMTALKVEAARLSAKPVTQVRNADGTTTWRIVTVGGFVPPSDVQQFIPAGLNIASGDTVVWESAVPTPHTVTFLGGTPAGGPLMSLEDPRLAPAPAPAAGYGGTGYVNSGILGVGFGPNPPFSVKFTSTGTFPYICILHVDQGMGGTITVGASTQATAVPAPPKTGGMGGLASNTTPLALAALLGTLALAVLAGSRVVTRRMR